MTTAVIAVKNGTSYQYVTVARNTDPGNLIPVLAFMVRYGRTGLHLTRHGAWTEITPDAVVSEDAPFAVKGFGNPALPGAGVNTVADLAELSDKHSDVYLLDTDAATVVHGGKTYKLMESSQWGDKEMRARYSTIRHNHGF